MMASEIDLENVSLPISSEANTKLEQEVHQKQQESEKITHDINEHNDRIQVIQDHLKNVRQEQNLTQALYEARKNDVLTEKHLTQIAERQDGRLRNELNRLKLYKDELKERMNSYENSIYRTNKKSEDLRAKMNWDQQALEAWLEESARRDEDALTISKYARADESKIKELTLKLEQLNEILVQKKRSLNCETTETLTAQIELDNTADAFRQTHEERQQLISQWEKIIQQMKRRDLDMDRTATELAQLKAEIKILEDLIREKQDFEDQEKKNNKEMENRISVSESLSAKHRLEYQENEKSRIQLRDELETLKYSVDRTAADLESMRSQNHHLARDVKDRTNRLETVRHQREIMQQELKKSTLKTLNAEERAHQMDQLLAEEEGKVVLLEKELSTLREKQFKKAQEVHDLKKSQQNMEAEIQGSRVTLRNLRSKQYKVDEEAMKQQELLYTQDFQLQQLEHKLKRLEGERTEEETTHLYNKIKELDTQWEEQHHSEQVLRAQLKTLQDDLRRGIRQVETGCKEKDILVGKIDELNLHIDSTQRELKKVVTAKQNLMVDENIIKLEVKRLRDTLFSRSDQVLSLEKQKLQFHTAMTERTKEIGVHKEMLKAQIKSCQSERQTVSGELQARIAKIDRLRKRYEILVVSMSPPEGEEEHSQTYYVIKAAQEREELQREGDELDAKIRKAEKEIHALENTLAIMNTKNESYRKSLQKVDPSGEDSMELEILEGQFRAVMDKSRHKKKQLRQLETDILSLSNTLTSITSEEELYQHTLNEKKDQLAVLQKDLRDMKTKTDRAAHQTVKLVRELRTQTGVTGKTNIEEDIELRELRDFNTNILQQIGTLASQDPHLTTTVQLLLSQVGLPPPPSPSGSRTSSLPTSARSSTSQLSTTSSKSTVSSRQSTPRQSVQTKTVDMDLSSLSLKSGTTPPRTSSSSTIGSRQSSKRQRTPVQSKTPSTTSSRNSSRPSSSLDLTVRPL